MFFFVEDWEKVFFGDGKCYGLQGMERDHLSKNRSTGSDDVPNPVMDPCLNI